MIEKPPCFGQPCLAAGSPCHRCGVLAACARRFTQGNAFGLLMWPRISAGVTPGDKALPVPLRHDPAIEAALVEHMAGAVGLDYFRSRRSWKVRREVVLQIVEASAARTTLRVVGKGPGHVSVMRSASLGVEVAPDWSGVNTEGTATVLELSRNRAWAPSTLVSSVGWRPAAQVASEAVAVYFMRDDDERPRH